MGGVARALCTSASDQMRPEGSFLSARGTRKSTIAHTGFCETGAGLSRDRNLVVGQFQFKGATASQQPGLPLHLYGVGYKLLPPGRDVFVRLLDKPLLIL